VIERSYALADAPDAVRHVEQGKARGKVVITI
jgi:NADPH:quinone reductase-like Zn-dependent oxidoreductase